jgi:hypothetical protein
MHFEMVKIVGGMEREERKVRRVKERGKDGKKKLE